MGDSSDNIPGLPGLGKVAATKLLLKFGTIEGIYEQIEEVTPPRAKKILMENKDEAFRGKVLTTIRKDAPVELEMDECRFWNYERDDVVNLLRGVGIRKRRFPRALRQRRTLRRRRQARQG